MCQIPKNVKEGGYFTRRQKRQILEQNKRQNGGVIKSDKSGKSGKILDPPLVQSKDKKQI